jgi:endonuclease/exonuclease/phosphatase family metal-dependent hydrolase
MPRLSPLLLAGVIVACATRPAPATAIRVMVYNIHAGKDAGGVDNLDRVAEVVRRTSADIVLLQEVDRGTQRSGGVDQLAVLMARTGFHGAFGKSLAYQGGDYGIAVLSRWPIASTTTIPLVIDPPQARAGGSYEPRVALRAVIRATRGDITIMNTHLDASRDDRWRRQEVAHVLAVADSVDGVLLLGGDFNSTPESAEQQSNRCGRAACVMPGRCAAVRTAGSLIPPIPASNASITSFSDRPRRVLERKS